MVQTVSKFKVNKTYFKIRMLRLLVVLLSVFISFSSYGEKMYASNELSEKVNLSIIKQNQEIISQLIDNLKKSNDKEYKISILYTLGELRAIASIALLIENIDYGISEANKGLPKYSDPAVKALAKIGVSSITPILDAIKKNSNSFKLALLCNALTGIDGSDLAIFYLRKEIKKTKDIDDAKKLKAALQIIVRYTPVDK